MMEHLLLPTNPTKAEIRVPCVCNPPYYDGLPGAFLTYPGTKEKPWLVLDNQGTNLVEQIGFHEIRCMPNENELGSVFQKELESFYQQWLFFGFLKEILKDDFDANDFVTKEKDATFITTHKLLSKLVEASRKRLENPQSFPEAAYQRLQDYVIVIFKVVKTTQSKVPPFDWRIMLSIISSAQTIARFWQFAYRLRWKTMKPMNLPGNTITFLNSHIEREMKEAGWCPSELHAITTKFTSIQVLTVLSRMNRRFLGRSHEKCTQQLCKWFQIPAEGYQPKHRCANCSCKPFQSKQMDNDVENILSKENSGLPVLEISVEGESLSVKVVETESETEFVAISHVWADGMGNPGENSLPRCQLTYLKHLVANLAKKARPSADPGKMYIWIDTLCCPCKQSTAKKNAIKLLRKTYEKATHVLVLDAGLQSLTLDGLPAWETLLWIFSSGWTSRLWTLQEGILPKSLWFQFQDQAEDFTNTKARLSLELARDSRVMDIYYDLPGQFRWLDMRRGAVGSSSANDPSKGTATQAFITLSLALQHRSVSFAADETLCISTLMDLDSGSILEVPEEAEARMCRLWELFDDKYGGIPIGILTLGYPRLKTPGFRWAPRTLLERTITANWLQNMAFPGLGRIDRDTKNGLLIKSAGFIVTKMTREDGLFNNPWESIGPRKGNFVRALFRTETSGTYYTFTNNDYIAYLNDMQPCPWDNYLESLPYAILPMTAWDKEGTCEALLGKCQDLGSGKHRVTECVSITFSKHRPNFNLLLSTAEEIACSARGEDCTMQLNDFHGDTKSDEFRILAEKVKDFLRAAAQKKAEEDEEVMKVLESLYRERNHRQLTNEAFDWFWNDYIGQNFGDEKEWYVDGIVGLKSDGNDHA